jgi:hypothetical protein
MQSSDRGNVRGKQGVTRDIPASCAVIAFCGNGSWVYNCAVLEVKNEIPDEIFEC